jgi:hypothetical protein
VAAGRDVNSVDHDTIVSEAGRTLKQRLGRGSGSLRTSNVGSREAESVLCCRAGCIKVLKCPVGTRDSSVPSTDEAGWFQRADLWGSSAPKGRLGRVSRVPRVNSSVLATGSLTKSQAAPADSSVRQRDPLGGFLRPMSRGPAPLLIGLCDFLGPECRDSSVPSVPCRSRDVGIQRPTSRDVS